MHARVSNKRDCFCIDGGWGAASDDAGDAAPSMVSFDTNEHQRSMRGLVQFATASAT